MKESLRDYYYHPGFTMADKSFMMIPTPKDFGQYLQQKTLVLRLNMYIYMILNWKDQYIERKMMLR